MVSPTPIAICLLILLHAGFVLVWSIGGFLYYIRDVYGPTLKFPYQVGKDNTLNYCGPTTDNLEDLIVHSSLSKEEASDLAKTHGMAIIPRVLSMNTTSSLRNYILKTNLEVESTYVLHEENRFHIMPTHTEPAIQAALKEIASHPVFKPLIDDILGPQSSLVAFSVITNLFGAQDQEWHYDTATSHANYPDEFVPEYTLAIPLQDTTKEMGATGICPGTHVCSWPDLDWNMMEALYEEDSQGKEDDFPDFDTWSAYNLPCELTASVKAGDGLLYNADSYHRGAGHKDATAPERVVMFLTFAASRQDPGDTRSLPLGTVHSLHWRSWGHTIDDFLTVDTDPWRIWHIFGWFSPCKENGVRPWTVQDYFLMIFKHRNEAMHMISADFDQVYFSTLVDDYVWNAGIATAVYLAIAPFMWLAMILQMWKSTQSSKRI
eukprot:scaffold6189_cov101-Cylindrotheca_fusiformis.AAC.6